MSADVIDVICSENMPNGTRRLIEFLKNSIRAGSFHPFDGLIYACLLYTSKIQKFIIQTVFQIIRPFRDQTGHRSGNTVSTQVFHNTDSLISLLDIDVYKRQPQ